MPRAFHAVGILALALTGCGEMQRAHQSNVSVQNARNASIAQYGAHVKGPCEHHLDDSNEYIFKTCEALVANATQVLAHPNTWSISRIAEEKLFGRAVTAVHFSCCGPGYTAFFDQKGKFIGFAQKKQPD